ncbi:Fumarylacetoacetase-like C-terminal domain-containing protein [Cupriavidus sp. H19C3]|uniref:2-keto-4-pentenoate hydratase n=1 Tax=Cupriavidus sp. H19C3 TaxID=3241603 RepID=UPI003BF8566A
MQPAEISRIAEAFQRAQAARSLIDADTHAALRGIDIATGYRAGNALHERLVAQGFQPSGRKIGCTNQQTWAKLGIDAPIVAPIYAQTVQDGAADGKVISRAALQAPRIELELAFRLKATPDPAASLADLIDCIEWIAPAIEVVDSHVDAAQGTPATILCDFGAHAMLLLGTPVPVSALPPLTPAMFAAIDARFQCADTDLAGGSALVMGSPLISLQAALRIAAHPASPLTPIGAGEIVTTGALAGPVALAPGQRWMGRLSVAGRDDLTVGVA